MFRMSFILSLAVLAILSSNMYVPAIPLIQQAFSSTTHETQLSLSYYMLGLAVGIVFYGPVSDHFGRKPLLAIGLLLYTVGMVMSALSTSITMLLVSRVIQALGAAAALSLWQAMAVDVFKEQVAKVIALGYTVIGFVPALSPFVGSYLVVHGGWRGIFFLLAVYGLILLVVTLFSSETKTAPSHSSSWIVQAVKNYQRLFTSGQFMLPVVLSAMLYSSLYVFMAQTPSLLHDLSYSTKTIGLFYTPISVMFILGSSMAKVLSSKGDYRRFLLSVGMLAYFSGLLLQWVVALGHFDQHWLGLIAPYATMSVGTGVLLPMSVASAMKIFTDISGSSAATVGVAQNALAFLLSALGAALSVFGSLGLTFSMSSVAMVIIVLSGLFRRQLV